MSTIGIRTFCLLTVHTRIEFENLTTYDAPSRIALWKSAMEKYWDNDGAGWRELGCKVRFTFATRERGAAATPGWHQVQMRSAGFTSWSRIGPASVAGAWGYYAPFRVIAHEVGHLMGLPVTCIQQPGTTPVCDEYVVTSSGGYVNHHQQPADPQCVMAQTWGDVAVVPPHVPEIMALVGLECTRRCYLLRPWDLLRAWRRPVAVPRPPSRPHPFRELHALTVREVLDAIDPDLPMTISLAEYELARRGDRITDDLLEAIGRSTELQRIAIAAALQSVGLENRPAIAALERMVAKGNPGLRLHAGYALAVRNRPEGREAIEAERTLREPVAGHPPLLASELAEVMLASLPVGGEAK